MQHHQLKKYLEFTVNKKPENIKKFAQEPTAIWKNFIIKEGCQIGYQWQNANKVYIFKKFSWRLYSRSLSQNDLNCFQNRLDTCGFADRNFFYISNPERFFSSLKKTIVLYLVKKFETFMVIFTSGRRRVIFKKRFFISASRTIHLTLNLQARHYKNINYYNIYTCSFTQYYLSMLRNKFKKLKVVYYCIQIYSEMFGKIIHLSLKNNKNAILVFVISSITF